MSATSASRWSIALAPLLAVACSDPPASAPVVPDAGVAQPPPTVTYSPPAPVLRRLTQSQYVNAIHDLLGDDLLVTRPIEPDVELGGSISVGAAGTSISPRGVEQYEALAYDLAEQLLRNEARRARVVSCAPAATADATCAETFVRATGRRLWRRPLADAEVTALVTLAGNAATTLGDFHRGLEYALSAMLQSPNFLFRAELAEPAAGAEPARFGPYSLAARLSFFLWNAPPDDALLAAAADGRLATDDGVRAEVERLAASPRLARGLRAFVTEWLGLQHLDAVSKDPTVFASFSSDVPAAAREETLSLAEHLALTRDADFRDLLTTRETFVNRRLASIYNVRAPSQTRPDGFGLVTMPDDSPRRGLLGHVSILALAAHPTSTSPTLRGKFIREALLCNEIPMPPVNVNTALPEPAAGLRTMRERLSQHQANPSCRGCHVLLDPIGLALEHFNGMGAWRPTDQGAAIDASGAIDGAGYRDALGLGQTLHDTPAFPRCVTTRLYRFAYGRHETEGEEGEVGRLAQDFAYGGYRLRRLMSQIATSAAFRRADGRSE
ncbi:MAG: Cellulose-binding domain protein [Myxococcaceae bacterium]|nr:Cellulose-binding domain protein [Myxococcaceae bacterium]